MANYYSIYQQLLEEEEEEENVDTNDLLMIGQSRKSEHNVHSNSDDIHNLSREIITNECDTGESDLMTDKSDPTSHGNQCLEALIPSKIPSNIPSNTPSNTTNIPSNTPSNTIVTVRKSGAHKSSFRSRLTNSSSIPGSIHPVTKGISGGRHPLSVCRVGSRGSKIESIHYSSDEESEGGLGMGYTVEYRTINPDDDDDDDDGYIPVHYSPREATSPPPRFPRRLLSSVVTPADADSDRFLQLASYEQAQSSYGGNDDGDDDVQIIEPDDDTSSSIYPRRESYLAPSGGTVSSSCPSGGTVSSSCGSEDGEDEERVAPSASRLVCEYDPSYESQYVGGLTLRNIGIPVATSGGHDSEPVDTIPSSGTLVSGMTPSGASDQRDRPPIVKRRKEKKKSQKRKKLKSTNDRIGFQFQASVPDYVSTIPASMYRRDEIQGICIWSPDSDGDEWSEQSLQLYIQEARNLAGNWPQKLISSSGRKKFDSSSDKENSDLKVSTEFSPSEEMDSDSESICDQSSNSSSGSERLIVSRITDEEALGTLYLCNFDDRSALSLLAKYQTDTSRRWNKQENEFWSHLMSVSFKKHRFDNNSLPNKYQLYQIGSTFFPHKSMKEIVQHFYEWKCKNRRLSLLDYRIRKDRERNRKHEHEADSDRKRESFIQKDLKYVKKKATQLYEEEKKGLIKKFDDGSSDNFCAEGSSKNCKNEGSSSEKKSSYHQVEGNVVMESPPATPPGRVSNSTDSHLAPKEEDEDFKPTRPCAECRKPTSEGLLCTQCEVFEDVVVIDSDDEEEKGGAKGCEQSKDFSLSITAPPVLTPANERKRRPKDCSSNNDSPTLPILRVSPVKNQENSKKRQESDMCRTREISEEFDSIQIKEVMTGSRSDWRSHSDQDPTRFRSKSDQRAHSDQDSTRFRSKRDQRAHSYLDPTRFRSNDLDFVTKTFSKRRPRVLPKDIHNIDIVSLDEVSMRTEETYDRQILDLLENEIYIQKMQVNSNRNKLHQMALKIDVGRRLLHSEWAELTEKLKQFDSCDHALNDDQEEEKEEEEEEEEKEWF